MIQAKGLCQLGRTACRFDCFVDHGVKCWHVQHIRVKHDVGITNPSFFEAWSNAGMSIGNIIRTLRKERGLSQSELAAALGWARGTIATLEGGHDRPGAELVQALATFFQTTTDHILGRDGVKQPAMVQNEDEAELLARFRDATPEARAAMLMTLRAMTRAN